MFQLLLKENTQCKKIIVETRLGHWLSLCNILYIYLVCCHVVVITDWFLYAHPCHACQKKKVKNPLAPCVVLHHPPLRVRTSLLLLRQSWSYHNINSIAPQLNKKHCNTFLHMIQFHTRSFYLKTETLKCVNENNYTVNSAALKHSISDHREQEQSERRSLPPSFSPSLLLSLSLTTFAVCVWRQNSETN